MASADVDITARPLAQDPSAPDPHGPLPGGNAAPPTRDDLDDLFDYDHQTGDTFQDAEGNNDAARTGERQRDRQALDADLGIDEEIKIRKPRKPVAKLDEERLLSQNGIPKLRRISKTKLKFRGKGHEFADVQRMLNTYQLWLDDLFPKAKFADGLTIIEKLGHKKRMKMLRQEWINEEKPKSDSHDSDVDRDFAPVVSHIARGDGEGQDQNMDESMPYRNEEQRQPPDPNAEEDPNRDSDIDSLYDDPPAKPQAKDADVDMPDDQPEEDELDALLAEDAISRPVPAKAPNNQPEASLDEFADDEEAMAGMW